MVTEAERAWLAASHTAARKKKKKRKPNQNLARMRVKYKHPRLVKSLGSNWDWCQRSSTGLFPMIFRDAYVIQTVYCLLTHCKILLCADRRENVFVISSHLILFISSLHLLFCLRHCMFLIANFRSTESFKHRHPIHKKARVISVGFFTETLKLRNFVHFFSN